MKILVSGSTGLVGTALMSALVHASHQVERLVRPSSQHTADDILWNPLTGQIDGARLNGFDGVAHLAGENIVGRWTAAKKKDIRDSRVHSTQLLSTSLAQLETPPQVLVCASAIGYYGDRGEEILTEDSAPGSGFLSDVCREWESAAEPAKQAGIRVVHLRIGVVLTSEGGALVKMLPAFRLGGGGIMGSGRQYMSWIGLDELTGIIHYALSHDKLSGPINAVAPHPVTNLEFTKTVGRVLNRPTLFPFPAFAARLMFGEMADALLLSSTRVQPERLLNEGYRFRYPDLEDTVRHVLDR